jgi:hypothetical protein
LSRWFRHYAGMMSDPKFGGVARFCKRSRAEVLFVWGCLLESASEYDSATYSWDADAMAELLGIETEDAQAIHDALLEKGLIEAGRIASWDKRQFKSDDSSERVREHRKRRRAVKSAQGNGYETLHVTPVTPPETETETDKPPKPPEGQRPRRRPQTACPEGFPDETALAAMRALVAQHSAKVDVGYHAQRFRSWALSKDQRYADWPMAFRNWIEREVRDAPRSGPASRPISAQPVTPEIAAHRLQHFRQTGEWKPAWGDRPNLEDAA